MTSDLNSEERCTSQTSPCMSAYVTTGVYTKAEELHAKRAYELIFTSGHPLMAEAVHLVKDGNITDMPKNVDENLLLDETKRVLYSDIMHVHKCRNERRSQSEIGFTLQGQWNLLCSRSFVSTVVHTDPQSAFSTLNCSFLFFLILVVGDCY
jgi:hypothetical protein